MIVLFLFLLFLSGELLCNVSEVVAQSGSIQNDGHIIIVGNSVISGTSEFLLSRYGTDGSLDSSFGSNGIVTTAIGDRAEATSTFVQSTGNIVVAGFAIINNITQFVVARYTADGNIDTTFGQAGTGIVAQIIGEGSSINSCAAQHDGSIVIAGNCVINGQPQIALMRLTIDGAVDSTFGDNGVVTLPIGEASSCQSVGVQADDRIVIGGSAAINSVTQMTIARFNIDGTLDSSFGSAGIVTIAQGERSGINALLIDSNQNIVAAGFSDNNMMAIRCAPSGSLDTSFGISGITLTSIGRITQANALNIQSDGAIICTGFSDNITVLSRFTSSGILDTSFATNGISLNIALGQSQANDVLLQNDGTCIVIGISNNNNAVILRYLTNGNIDTSWGNLGIVTQSSSNTNFLITRIWEQKSVGTNGGSFIAGSWQTRTLTDITNTSNIALVNNQILLKPGMYSVTILAPAYKVGNHQARLYDITNNSTLLWGSSSYTNYSIGTQSYSLIEGEILVNELKTLEVQHHCTSTEMNDGFGIAAGLGDTEIYTTVKITPIT